VMVKAIASLILTLGILKSAFSLYWARNYGTEDIYSVTTASLTSDGGVIISGYTLPPLLPIKEKPFLLKLDRNGDVEWLRFYYGGENRFNSVIQTKDSGYVVVGYSNINGSKDMLVMKLYGDGSIKWQKTYGSNGYEVANSIVETEYGEFVILGTGNSFSSNKDPWVLKIDANGNIVWQKVYKTDRSEEAVKILKLNDGFILVGNTYGAYGYSIFLIKVDDNGNVVFGKTYSGYRVSSAALSTDGSVLLTGYFYSDTGSDIFVIKLDSNGDILWSKTYRSWSPDFSSHISGLSDSSSIVVGYKQKDLLLFKIDSTGNIVWQKIFGGSRGDFGVSGGENKDGDILVVGKTNSFGIVTTDIWVLKTDMNGDIKDCVYYTNSDLSSENLNISQQELLLNTVNTNVTGTISGITATDMGTIRGSTQCVYPIENEQPQPVSSGNGGGCMFEKRSNTGNISILILFFYFLIRKLKNHTRIIDSPNSTM